MTDATAGQSPAAVAPSANDTVTVGAAANGAAQVIIGNGNTYGLTLEGETLLNGTFKSGASGPLVTTQWVTPLVLNAGSLLKVFGDATFETVYRTFEYFSLTGGKVTVAGTLYASNDQWFYEGVSWSYWLRTS